MSNKNCGPDIVKYFVVEPTGGGGTTTGATGNFFVCSGTTFLSTISGCTDSVDFNGNTFYNNGDVFFGGVISACTGIHTSNIYGCSPITVHDELILLNKLTLSAVTQDDTLTQILGRDSSTGEVKYRSVESIITGATSQDTFVTGFTYNNANTFTITDNDGGVFNATINNVAGLTSNGNIEVVGNLIVTGGTGNVLTKQVYVENNLGLDWDFPSNSVVLGNNSDGTIINGTSLTINSDTLVNGSVSATTYFGDGSNLTGIDDTFVTGFTFNNSTYDLTIKQNEGQPDLVSNLAVLATDVYVVSGVYDPSTGIVTYTNSSGGTFQVSGFTTGMTDSYTTDAYLNGTEIRFDNNIQGVNFYNVDLLPLLSGFTTGNTLEQVLVLGNITNGNDVIMSEGDDVVFKYAGFNNNINTQPLTSNRNILFQDKSGTVALLSDTTGHTENTFVTGFTYNDANTFTISRNDGVDLSTSINAMTGLTVNGSISATTYFGDGSNLTGISTDDNFVTGGTLNSGTLILERQNGIVTITGFTNDVDTFSTGGTVTQSATSGDSQVTIQITGNDGFTPYNITGLTDTFVNDFSFSSNTFTITQNDGSTFEADVDTIDLANILSAVTFNIATSGTISATTFNGNTYNGGTFNGTFVGDGSGLTGITDNDTFVTGTTFSSNQAIVRRNDGADVFLLTGGTNVNLSNPSTNQIKIDVSLPSTMNTFTTGFTYNDANTLTISRNDGVNLNTSINTVTALTVTNYIDYTTTTKPTAISGRTYFDRDENALSYFPNTSANDVTINIGQESVIRVHNNTGVQINNGEVCHITSEEPSVNGVPSVILAIATGDTTTGGKYGVSGVATHDIPDGTEGFITSFGLVRDLNITGVAEGTEIYLSEDTPGAFRYTPPDTEFRRSIIGYVVTTGATDGKILVEITNEVGFSELSESLLSVVTENNASTGTRNGGEMTINSGDNTLFDISAGSGIIVDNYTDPNTPTIQNIVWDSITGNSVTNLTGDTGSFIFLDSNLNTVQFGNSNPPTEADYRDNIYLGLVGHANFTNLINVFNTPIQIVSPINQHQDLTSAIGPFSISGNRILNITGTLELEKTAGRSFFYGGNFHTDTKIPSNITTSDLSGSTLIYATGANVLGPSGTTIDPNNYDPNGAGTITAVPGTNQYVAHRIWHQPSQNLLIFQYGQAFYPNAATARDEFEFENYVVPAGLDDTSYLVAIIIAQDGDTDLDSATIIPQGKFAGTGGGGGSVADTLQTAYDNSSNPEIITDATRGAVDFRVGSGSDSDNVVTFQQNSGTINAFVEGTGDAKFTNLTGTSVTSNSAINVFNGHINLRDNSYFLQGRTVADANVSLIGVDNQDRVFVGNAGYITYTSSDTIVNGVLSAQTAFLTTTPTLNNSSTDILVRNSTTGEVEYRPVSGITPDTNTFVTGSTVTSNVLELTRNDSQQVLQLSGGTNAQFVDNGNNSITLNVTSGGGGGASVSFPWKFKEPTASSDPGSGHFRLNNTVASAITEVYVSDETNNSIDASNLLNILDVGDVIYIQQNDDATRALLFTVSASTVDNTGWFTIPVQYQQGSTIPKKDKVCGWIFASTGAEDNTVSNVGVGQGVFKQRNVNDFEFYSLSGGSNTTLSLNNDTIVIDVAIPPNTNTFVTGTTFSSNQATVTRNDGTDVLFLTGGTNVTLSNPSTNQIKIDVASATPTLSVVSVTGTTYSATTSDDVIGFDTSSVTPTLFLPDSTSSGTKRYEVKDIGVNSRRNPITIQAAGSDTIITTSVVSSFELSADGGAVILVSTGTGQWWQM